MNGTIIALATPPLKSALAILRLSGPEAFSVTSSLMGKEIEKEKGRHIVFVLLKDGEKLLDEAIVLVYPGPNSMTGEDVVEICCHGSMLIVEEIVEAYLRRGVRYAGPGEFSARGFYNGKMDLVEAEAIDDLINATTKEAKELALLSLKGEASAVFKPIKEEIAELLAKIEVNIDYPEYEDIEQTSAEDVIRSCMEIVEKLSSLIKEGEDGLLIRNGVKVALVGEPNVGKSTILNALLKDEKAIVSPIPGTTRDVVEGEIAIRGIPVKLFDTAGIRDTEDQIEKLGVERSSKTIREADLVIRVLGPEEEGDDAISPLLEGKKVIAVHNKADLIGDKKEGELYVSALQNDVEPLKKAIFESLSISEKSFGVASFGNKRELTILKTISDNLLKAKQDAETGVPLDLVSVSLQEAYNKARELLGEEKTRDYGGEIFSRFCVGK